MASPGFFDDDGYSDEEEDELEDNADSSEVASWCKDHQEKSSQLSELVSVSDFQAQCSCLPAVARGSYGHKKGALNLSSTSSELGISVPEVIKLQEECNPKKLLPPDGISELRKLDLSKMASESSFKCLKQTKQLRELFHKGPATYGYDQAGRESEGACEDMVPSGEVVLSVAVFHPITKNRDQEYAVLGSQCLTVLRDRIVCYNDYLIKKDFSENPNSFAEHVATLPDPPNVSPSAYIFVNNTFYNDSRHTDSIDLSKPIIEWASERERLESSRRLEQFSAADMATTTFLQLSLRLGYPYLFTHHTDCEHMIMFTDMRIFHRGVDKLSVSAYPRLTYRHRRRVIKCQLCKASEPTWVTVNDELAISSPCHFCEECFIKLHYSKDGTKITSFEAYPFHPASH